MQEVIVMTERVMGYVGCCGKAHPITKAEVSIGSNHRLKCMHAPNVHRHLHLFNLVCPYLSDRCRSNPVLQD